MGFFSDKTIRAALVFEMLGKPKEHLQKVMGDFLAKLPQEKGITIASENVHPAKQFEDKDKEGKPIKTDLFSTFAEVEIEADKMQNFLPLIFKYMPSHIEVISPENLDMSNTDLNNLANDLIARLHQYDSVAKTAMMQNQMLAKKIMELQQQGKLEGVNIVEQTLPSSKPKTKKAGKKSKKK